ncbi:MAG: glycosyltransferase [Candidatus Binatia bacterium]|jgi:L-malate glycosyltransferase
MSGARPTILLVGGTLELGGTEGQFAEVACRLDRSRFDVRVSCMRPEGPLRSRLEAAGVSIGRAGRGSLRPVGFVSALVPLVRELRAHDVRIVHSFDFYSNLLCVPAARLSGRSTAIASQRDLGNLRSAPRQRVHDLALQFAHLVVVNSEAVRDALVRSGRIAASRLTVVRNGVDLARFRPRRGEPRSAADPVTVVTLANLRPEKGLTDLLDAAAILRRRLPACRFQVWGDGPLRGELEARALALGLDGTLELRGRTEAPEAVLRSADVFALPSHSEASSNGILEAMASGLPVVATRVGGNPLLVEDGATGLLVPARDPGALAESIARLVENPDEAARFGDAALERIRRRFSTESMIRELESVYGGLLGQE